MKAFVDWVSGHVLVSLLIAGTTYAVWYVVSNRKKLFYRE